MPSGPRPRWERAPSRSSPTRTARASTASRPTRPTRSASEGHPVRAYLDHEAIVAQAVEAGADAIYPGYGFLSENPLLAEACDAAGITFVGPPASVLHLTGNKARAIAAARAAGLPTLHGSEPGTDLDALEAAADDDRLPRLRQGGLGRRRTRYAPGGVPRDAARLARGGPARGRVGLRRPDALPRGGRGQPAAHRGAGAGRQHRRGRPPLRARLLAAASPPEGRRDRPGAQPRRRHARADVRRRRRLRPLDRLRQRRHGRVPPRRGRTLRLHRDEPPHPGRAHGHRGGHRHRPRRHAAADRRG